MTAGSRSELHCRADRRDTRVVDGLHWPISYAAGIAARYLRARGDRAALGADLWDHLAFVHGWTTWRGDRA